jgi:hypothetical protein
MSKIHKKVSKEQPTLDNKDLNNTIIDSSSGEDIPVFPCEWANQVLSECLAQHARDWRKCQSQVQLLKKCMMLTNTPSSSSTIEKMRSHK